MNSTTLDHLSLSLAQRVASSIPGHESRFSTRDRCASDFAHMGCNARWSAEAPDELSASPRQASPACFIAAATATLNTLNTTLPGLKAKQAMYGW